MDFEKVKDTVKSAGFPAYRIAQIRAAVFRAGARDWDCAAALPAALRALLKESGDILSFRPVLIQASKKDPVYKALLQLKDGLRIETVLMRPGRTWSACVSSQAGCPLGCAFCATGKMGFKRNLTAEEISDQVLFWYQFLLKEKLGERVSNVVFMGMGEPLLNYNEVVKAVHILSNPDFLGIGQRHISVSTAGVADKFAKLAADLPQVNLALSLHNADDEERGRLMPVNKKFNLAALKDALEDYLKRSGREVFLEYTVIDGVNNLPGHVRKLGKWINEFRDHYLLHVNLIACNPAVGKAVATGQEAVKKFAAALRGFNVRVSLRKSLGGDIAAACGQLASKNRRRK
ncbi:MAG: 23S rRNA (adenine(2503)-C(2))-methyltransferase RlmN [Elusimicrobiota bacterium]|jgi:23S rRNA (adenine(2503)-C(2))-methyltransferase|nr:23S rRNA (adenine(2503)-C(2))-methyltransferase RlmN [Elusimicrobiota bacterium]